MVISSGRSYGRPFPTTMGWIFFFLISGYLYDSVLGTVESPKLLQELFNVLEIKPYGLKF